MTINANTERKDGMKIEVAEGKKKGIQTAPIELAQISIIPEEEEEPEREEQADRQELDAEECRMLMKIAMAEAEGESVEGKALVMRVILNRVQDEAFPDTVEEVINQKGQFSPVEEGGRYYTTEYNSECQEALEMVLEGWDESQGALYFESCANDSWHSRNLEYLFEEGNHRFYR